MTTTIHQFEGEDVAFLRELCIGTYLDGKCYIFAIALHRGTGWPIVGLMDGEIVCHAAVRCPDGMLFDARGPLPEEKFRNHLSVLPPYEEIRTMSEADLLDIHPTDERGIESTLQIAKRLWPNLPWKNSLQSKVSAFADALEELSREHGFWIRAQFPGSLPVISKEVGSEVGYDVTPSINSGSFFLDRRLK